MDWINQGGHWFTTCGRGRVTGTDGEYCQAHYRAAPFQGVWEPVRTESGQQAWRRTIAAAKAAVEAWVADMDRETCVRSRLESRRGEEFATFST